MPPRLLSLLSFVEHALCEHGCTSVNTPPQRAVNFEKGMARMIFNDHSGSIALQRFCLADGEICVRAQYSWSLSQATSSYSVYPSGENYDWTAAAARIAEGWLQGMTTAAAAPAGRRARETQSGLERLAVAS